jgi:hypothetical protein
LAVVITTVNLLREAKICHTDSHVISQPAGREFMTSATLEEEPLITDLYLIWPKTFTISDQRRPGAHQPVGYLLWPQRQTSDGGIEELLYCITVVCVRSSPARAPGHRG